MSTVTRQSAGTWKTRRARYRRRCPAARADAAFPVSGSNRCIRIRDRQRTRGGLGEWFEAMCCYLRMTKHEALMTKKSEARSTKKMTNLGLSFGLRALGLISSFGFRASAFHRAVRKRSPAFQKSRASGNVAFATFGRLECRAACGRRGYRGREGCKTSAD